MSPKQGSALVSLSHSVIGGEQPAGSLAFLQWSDGFPKAAVWVSNHLGPSCKRLAYWLSWPPQWLLGTVAFKAL